MNDAVKKAVESLYNGTCTVYVKEEATDPTTHITKQVDKTIYENEPCHLSFGSLSATKNGKVDELVQTVTLFIAPEVKIPPGSKIVVTQNDSTESYKQSGVPARYYSHQEIPLTIFERYA